MQTNACSFTGLTDDRLIATVKELAAGERRAMVDLIAALAELDARRLYLGQGCASLYTYCTQCLHLSEHAAYGRIAAARVARTWPLVLEMLGEGSITLTTVSLLRKHLTDENHRVLLEAARFKTRDEVEAQVAALRPLPDVPSSVRKLPELQQEPSAAAEPSRELATADVIDADSAPLAPTPPVPSIETRSSVPLRPAAIAPLAPERYKVQFTVSRECHDKLRRVQGLLRHSIPDGDPGAIFERALTLLLGDLEKRKLAQTDRPRAAMPPKTHSRHVPAAVRRAVWKRDGGRCAFVGPEGRCTERGFLEFHHLVPFADDGATSVENVALHCRSHNAHEAELWFGRLIEAPEATDSV